MSESKIPAIGSIVTVQMFGEQPKPEAPEDVAAWERRLAVKIKVRLMGRSIVRRAAYAMEKIEADEKKLLRDARAADDAANPLRPELFREGYMTEQGMIEMTEHMRAVLGELLVGVVGLEVEGMDLAGERDVPTLCDILDQCDLMPFTYWASLAANRPRLSQLF